MPKISFFILLIIILSCFLTTAGCNNSKPKVEDMNNCEQNPICRLSCSVFYHCDYVESVAQCIEERSNWDWTSSLATLKDCVDEHLSPADTDTDFNLDEESCEDFFKCVTDTDTDTGTGSVSDTGTDTDTDTDADTDTDTDFNTDTDTDTN
jgi:hypothetical protein